jgi:hypothetical protein
MVKLPLPVQPLPPERDQVPAIEFPVTVPVKVRSALLEVPEVMSNWKWPLTLPLKSPVNVKVPVSVPPDIGHDASFVVKVKLLTVSAPLLPLATKDVDKANTGFPFVSLRVACQFPLILPGLWLLEPQPTSVRLAKSNTITANFFIENALL